MKLKRFLSLCAVSIFAAALLAGCSSDNTQDTQASADTTSSDSSQTDTYRHFFGFTGYFFGRFGEKIHIGCHPLE